MKTPVVNGGLTTEAALASRKAHGSNELDGKEQHGLLAVLKDVVTEPMFILLLLACGVYFLTRNYPEGFFMLVSIFLVAGISIFQEFRSRNALEALQKLSAPHARVYRDGNLQQLNTGDIVQDDLILIEEGEIVPADGEILLANDLSLNESILTGESLPVHKPSNGAHLVYRGTLVTSGTATVRVTAVGASTQFGKIGLSLQEIRVSKTPLQLQIAHFVKYMLWIGAITFAVVVGYQYYLSKDLLHSFMHGLTLAMSILPEEIPVAFSTFQALGVFRLLRQQIVVKQPRYAETLGAATVICTDKTGTITQNRMAIAYLYDAVAERSVDPSSTTDLPERLVEYAMWSSETNAFDPMEKAIHVLYGEKAGTDKRKLFIQVHEYPIGGKPPFMTHIFRNEATGETIIAAKGAPEAILKRSGLSIAGLKRTEEQAQAYARQGFRVLGVGRGSWQEKEWPLSQESFHFEFLGLIAFQDPPKPNMDATIRQFSRAGIAVKMITGDYAETALAIAAQVHLQHDHEVMTGQEVLSMPFETLKEQVRTTDIYARMFPEAKLRVIDALKENGEIVAMTGDGVNDAPALKAAHIGIAMGQRGSEVARNAAALILTDDDLGHMTDAIALGRKIYDNLKKAIRYIVSIHIPIILIVTLPLLLRWKYPDLFSPVHVIFLELIMGPTCSIIYENEPMEPGTMDRPPRRMGATFLSFRQLLISIFQGLMITAGCLGLGAWLIREGQDADSVRTAVFMTLLFSNIFLTFVNRSFRYTVTYTMRYKNQLIPLITGVTILLMAFILFVPFMRGLFNVVLPGTQMIMLSMVVAFVAVFWIEVLKAMQKLNG